MRDQDVQTFGCTRQRLDDGRLLGGEVLRDECLPCRIRGARVRPQERDTVATVPADTTPIERDEIFAIVRDRLADILEIDPSGINEGDSFSDDLDADSLALIELVEAIEEEMGERTVGFRIDDEDLEDLKTVRDAVDYVFGRLGGS